MPFAMADTSKPKATLRQAEGDSAARLPVPVPKAASERDLHEGQEINPHPYQSLDRITRAMLARQTGGVSPYSILQAWSDWALHLSRAPGRQAELVERGFRNLFEVSNYTMRATLDRNTDPPFRPSAMTIGLHMSRGRGCPSRRGSSRSLPYRTGGTTRQIPCAV